MSHWSEKAAEFVLGELSATEMAEARRHLAECANCRGDIEQFQRTHALLKTSPDVEPPRRIVFEAERPSFSWRWAVPLATAAAVVIAVLVSAPIDIRWSDSQVTIALGTVPQTEAPEPIVTKEPAIQPIDYERVVAAVRDSQQVWLTSELNRLQAAHALEIQRLTGDIAYLENMQRAVMRETMDNSSSIQLLARSNSQE
jgi:hypothetical protein